MSQEFLSQPIHVAILGSGGREHALARKIAASPLCASVVVLPGNDGMLLEPDASLRAKISIEPWISGEFAALPEKLRKRKIELVIVGPDDLLALGAVDFLEREKFLVFGPTQAAAKIESSKSFAKELMQKTNVKTARSVGLSSEDATLLAKAAETLGGYPIVLKYDGLALGKGVRICIDEADATAFLKEVFSDKKFQRKGGASATHAEGLVIAEEFLSGHEVSVFAVCNGKTHAMLAPACDHKRLNDGNNGPNTGGMGAYSPVPWFSAAQLERVNRDVFAPVLKEMAARKTPFKGLLYAGLMVSGEEFWVLEFNARFGDPETQALLPRLKSDLLPVLYGAAKGEEADLLDRHIEASPMRWEDLSCVNIVVASPGYPDKPITGHEITINDSVDPGTQIFYSGVKATGKLETAGGRVLSVSALAQNIEQASASALSQIAKIHFEGMHYRRDIGRVKSVL